MKFLLITNFRDSYYTLPKEKRAELTAAGMSWVDRCMKSGKCQEGFMLGNFSGTVSIWDVASSEEMARNFMEWPGSDYSDVEVTPLIEYEVTRKIRMEGAAAAQKKTPQKVPAMSR